MKAKDILKTEGIVKNLVTDTVAQAISQLTSSHDVSFVFDENGKYVGVINPYYSLIKHRQYLGNSLVKNCLFHPPKVSPNDTVERIVGLMISSHLHYLPVFDKNVFKGIVSARRIIATQADSSVYKKSIQEALDAKEKPLVSVYADDEVSKVVHLFEDMDVSKLVVIEKNMKLAGILSYHDLVPYLIAPIEKENNLPSSADYSDDPYAHLKVKNVAKTRVHTCSIEGTIADCMMDMVKLQIGSVVIVNKEGFPSGILTMRDVLGLLKREEVEPLIELSTNSLSPSSIATLNMYGPHLERWMKKIPNLERAHMLVKEEKNGGLYTVTFTVFPRAGKSMTYKEEGKNLLDVLKEINKNN